MEPWDYQQFNFTHAMPGVFDDPLPTRLRPQHAQDALANLEHQVAQLTRPKSNNTIHNPNPDMTTKTCPPAAMSIASTLCPADILDEVSHPATDSENRGGFFCFSIGSGPLPHGRACAHCKKAKIKCVFEPGEPANKICRRCRAGGYVCTVTQRKSRSPDNRIPWIGHLLPDTSSLQLRQKDRIIQSLLIQLQNRHMFIPPSMGSSPAGASNQTIPPYLQTSVHGKGHLLFSESSDKSEENFEREEHNDASVLPGASAPLGLLAKMSLSDSRRGRRGTCEQEPDNQDGNDIGMANTGYFEPGPATDLTMRARLLEDSVPDLVVHGIIVPEDVDKLFEIFHANLNPFISLLDPVLHTPISTFTRCPVLFTVVCAVSSRYYTAKSEIYPIAMHFAKHSASNALNEGWKTIELCQVYILLSIYSVPGQKWEEDCSWLYSGVAIRLATDLNLHQTAISAAPQENERQERELLNRTRAWMNCVNLDHSIAYQSGKPPTMKPDYVVKHRSEEWYSLSPYNSAYDLHLCATTGLLLVVAEFHDQIFPNITAPSGFKNHVDFRSVTIAHDAKLTEFSHKWANRFLQQSNSSDSAWASHYELFMFLTAYSRLTIFWFALEHVHRTGLETTDDILFTKCLESAKTVLRSMVEGLAPTGLMLYSPDGHFIVVAFASAVLLKLLGPQFPYFMPAHEETEVYDLLEQLYARLIAKLLSHQHRDSSASQHLYGQENTPQSIMGPSASNYVHRQQGSSIFTVSPLLWEETTAFEYQYHHAGTAPIRLYRPIDAYWRH
ncbi:hypothetical protein MSAN_00509000 [Mycena sanguinolenta]|uniref:Zn(2)-C6 fungal-type domain-containing protein n=1 Tax=Mycena sanguinolenta TaxID=230812 RepID=A0A8H7DIX8_9AGAR|nr:hypothetical protein MSAN_00509000 [Mycena sanguinolenta]